MESCTRDYSIFESTNGARVKKEWGSTSKQHRRPGIHILKWLWLAALLVFYLGLFYYTGMQTYSDSVQYITMHIRREPVYPIWLWIFRFISKESTDNLSAVYLNWACEVQCVLNAAVSWYFAGGITRIFHRGWKYYSLVCFLTTLPQIVTMQMSSNGIFLAGSVLSEALAIPVFYLFFIQLVKMALSDKNEKGNNHIYPILSDAHCWLSLALALLLSLIRSQFMAMMIAWMIVFIQRIFSDTVCWVDERTRRKNYHAAAFLALLPILILFTVFQLRTALIKEYSHATTGVYSTNSNFWNMALAYVLYNTDSSMSAAFSEQPELQELFDTMCRRMEEKQLGYRFEPKGITASADFLEDCYDPIKFDVIETTVFDAANEITPVYQVQNQIENEYSREILLALFPMTWKAFLGNYLKLAVRGLFRSILAAGRFMSVFAAAVYLFMIGILVTRRLRGKKMLKDDACRSMLLVCLLILGNAFGTALVSVDLSRYMIYTFVPFYSALGNLVIGPGKERKRINRKPLF